MKWSSWIFWIAGVIFMGTGFTMEGDISSVMHQIYQGQMFTTAAMLFIGGALCRGLGAVIDRLPPE